MEIPHEADGRCRTGEELHTDWWQARTVDRKRSTNPSLQSRVEYLYDKAYDDKKKVRCWAFTVESLSPHRVLV